MTTGDHTEIQDDDEREGSRQLSLQGNDPPGEIEGYSVVRRLGTGAYGTVWLAREDRTGRMVAIKYYPHRRGLNWSLLNREVEKLATLYSSRNIVRLLDVGWNAEPPYYVMEYVENGSLGQHLAAGPLPVDEAVRIAQQVCAALIEAHGAGVLHCDLKPDNVLLDSQFHVRLCDFGQSRMSHEQSPALGTLYYMAPEQADLEAIPDARWDVYAVGALLYHMLTGQPPYRSPDVQKKLEEADSLQTRLETYRDHIRQAPAAESHQQIKGVDRQLATIVDQCLAIEPADRLPNAQAVANLLSTRERNRSRKPLLLLGVVGPLLLIAAMLPIFVQALSRNVSEMETRLVERDQSRNGMLARSQANSLMIELTLRLHELSDFAAEPNTIEMMTRLMKRPEDEVLSELASQHDSPMEDRAPWLQMLDNKRARAMQRMQDEGKSTDVSWFLQNATGLQLWRRQYTDTVGRNWAHRDYFHGRNIEYVAGEAPEDVRPIQSPHVSLPFISKATDKYMVALTVPVKNDVDAVIGVLGRTIHLGELQRELVRPVLEDNSTLVLALADRRDGQLLDHPFLASTGFQKGPDAEPNPEFETLRLAETIVESINDDLQEGDDFRDFHFEGYNDPAAEHDRSYAREWMASMSAIASEKIPWVVIVQENREDSLAPVRKMEQRATRQAFYAVLASLIAMGAVWAFVWNALRRAKPGTR